MFHRDVDIRLFSGRPGSVGGQLPLQRLPRTKRWVIVS